MTNANKRFRLRLGSIIVIVACIGLVAAGNGFASPASASAPKSAAGDEYYKPPKVPTTVVESSNTTVKKPPTSTGGTLPFTGMSLIWPAVAAVALVGLGVGLRRHEKKNLKS